MEALPVEIIDYIFNFLSFGEISNLLVLNKYFNHFVKSNAYYSFCLDSFSTSGSSYISQLMRNPSYFERFILNNHAVRNYTYYFSTACKNNHLVVAKLSMPYVKVIKGDFFTNLFVEVCGKGFLEIAQWLREIDPKIDKPVILKRGFELACTNGRQDLAEWLKNIHPELKCVEQPLLFRVCVNRHLELAKWLLDGNEQFLHGAFTFLRESCAAGNLEMVKWCIEKYCVLMPKNSLDLSCCFCIACEYGHLRIAKFLLRENSTINIRYGCDNGFRHACDRGHYDTARWMTLICPNYTITSRTPDKISYKIDS